MSDPDFERLGQFKPDPGCWYKPCVDQLMEQYLVPYQSRHAPCDHVAVCTQLNQFINNGSVDVDDMKQDLTCDLHPDTPTPTPTPKPPKPTPDGNAGWWGSLSAGQKAAVLGGGVCASAAGLVGLLYVIKKMRGT
jgi:hypothetical protein